MVDAFVGYTLFVLSVLAACFIAYRYAEPLEKWFRKKIMCSSKQNK